MQRITKIEKSMRKVNTFGLIKAVSDTIFDMIVTTYHDKPLIFWWATFQEGSDEKCGFFPINANVGLRGVNTEQTSKERHIGATNDKS